MSAAALVIRLGRRDLRAVEDLAVTIMGGASPGELAERYASDLDALAVPAPERGTVCETAVELALGVVSGAAFVRRPAPGSGDFSRQTPPVRAYMEEQWRSR